MPSRFSNEVLCLFLIEHVVAMVPRLTLRVIVDEGLLIRMVPRSDVPFDFSSPTFKTASSPYGPSFDSSLHMGDLPIGSAFGLVLYRR